LFLFVALWVAAWRTAGWIAREGGQFRDTQWAARLANAVQVSLIAYLVGGAFLSLAYFDLPYDLLVILVVLKRSVSQKIAAYQAQESKTSSVTAKPRMHSPTPTSALHAKES
jgi:hypothetical protein